MPSLDCFSEIAMTAQLSSARAERLFEVLDRGSSSTCLITDLSDIRWLTGFSGSHAWLVTHAHKMYLITDGRYIEQARAEIATQQANVEVIECRTQAEMLRTTFALTQGSLVVQFQDAHVSQQLFCLLQAELSNSLKPLDVSSKFLRRFKDDEEIKIIESACRIADEALTHCRDLLSTGVTESHFRDEIDYTMRKLGADGPSYDTIVASGPIHAARPHHRPTNSMIDDGHTVIIDVGALVSGYHSDMTRTYLLGEVDPVLQTMLDVVTEAQSCGVAAVRAGELPSEIDRICRAFITEAGFGPEFVHGTGHGVGLNIHESPWLRAQSNEPLREGEVVTVEPGVYRVGLGGVRIEDLLLVRAAGSTTLTHTPKDSLCLQSRQTI